ncbi:2'-5' RNA ligase [Mumia flava]|uniref:2'-5' RNA ligase n=1 Tax=Mumia flava TaxID=1348852 RepID=A0A0B2BEA9_9ACTN|nr:2'-5' RNA ligase family protein [Mumia flava]PJJ48261.1 2'-5' RNA ligase [Mumia flava]
MALAVCLLFDPRSARRVRDLWTRLEDEGVHTLATHTHGRHHPHLSYAVLRTWDRDRVDAALSGLADGGPFIALCHGTLVFPRGRVALAPSLPADVALRQDRVVRALASAGADLHRHYGPGAWIPHVSVATRAPGAELPRVVKVVTDALPLEVLVDRTALIDTSDGTTWPLDGVL